MNFIIEKFINPNSTPDDYLKIVKYICCDILLIKTVRVSLFIYFIYYVAITLIDIYLLCQLEKELVFQYLPSLIIHVYPLVTLSTYLYLPAEFMSEMWIKLDVWPIKFQDKSVQAKTKFETQIIAAGTIFLEIVGLCGAILFFFSSEMNQKLLIISRILNGPESFKKILSLLFISSFLLLPYLMMLAVLQTLCSIYNFKLQVKLLCERVEELNRYISEMEDDQNDQRNITQTLNFFIKRRGDLCCVVHDKSKQIEYITPFYMIAGCGFAIGVILFFYNVNNMSFTLISYVQGLIIATLGTIMYITMITSGQALEDESDRFFNAVLMLKWYKLNQENKKNYLFLLTQSMAQFKVKFTQNISINHQLGFQLIKMVYGYTNGIFTLRKSNRTGNY